MPEDTQHIAPAQPSYSRPLLALFAILFISSGVLVSLVVASSSSQESQTAAAAETAAFPPPALEAKGAYVLDLTNGRELYAIHPDAQLPLASLTKVMLVLAISEVLPPEARVIVPSHTTPDGAPKRIPDGSTWRAQDLIDFTLVQSSNEGAEVLAQAADAALLARYPDAPAGAAALYRMNALAKEMGLVNTYFLNVSGLDMSPTQAGAFGSPRDVAEYFAYAYETDVSRFEGTAQNGLLRESLEGDQATAVNTDKALGDIPGLVMGKTGYTDLAGGNLVVVFDIGPAHPVIAVILGSSYEARFTDMEKLVRAITDYVTSQ